MIRIRQDLQVSGWLECVQNEAYQEKNVRKHLSKVQKRVYQKPIGRYVEDLEKILEKTYKTS